MGLDMYLRATRYIGGYQHNGAERAVLGRVLDAAGIPLVHLAQQSPVAEVIVRIGYWRKANAVHAWFVANVQGGKDECLPSDVTRDQLGELRVACTKAIASKDAHLLPPQSGFFFGSTEVDDHYWQDLRDTIVIIDRALALGDEWDISYRSSW